MLSGIISLIIISHRQKRKGQPSTRPQTCVLLKEKGNEMDGSHLATYRLKLQIHPRITSTKLKKFPISNPNHKHNSKSSQSLYLPLLWADQGITFRKMSKHLNSMKSWDPATCLAQSKHFHSKINSIPTTVWKMFQYQGFICLSDVQVNQVKKIL